jgi:hypothetical protein
MNRLVTPLWVRKEALRIGFQRFGHLSMAMARVIESADEETIAQIERAFIAAVRGEEDGARDDE